MTVGNRFPRRLMLPALLIACAAPFTMNSHAQSRTRRAASPTTRVAPAPSRATTAARQTTARVTGMPATTARRSITVQTEPGAFVWIDDIRRGTADASGALAISPVPAGRHTLRARARGFREGTVALAPVQRGILRVPLQATADEAEIAFGEAEVLREGATENTARERALELYNRAIQLRPRTASVHAGRARTLFDLARYDEALEAVDAARRARPVFPEASAIEGRILRSQGDTDGSIAAFERAIREARGRQPEAHTGLGLIYEEQGDHAKAAAAFRHALDQLQDSEPVIYQLLGSAYEQGEKYKEAVAAYEKYLALAPDGKLAPAIRSVIEQLRRQAAGENTLPY